MKRRRFSRTADAMMKSLVIYSMKIEGQKESTEILQFFLQALAGKVDATLYRAQGQA
jgi:hypothetical protein